MRIIAGTLKGRRLSSPKAGDQTVRPTSDMAREALFSILQRWPVGPFLDVFAGTAAVGVEAWSRGYGPVCCVENHPAALGCAEANVQGTDARILKRDVLRLGEDAFSGQAVIFCDPPYARSVESWLRLAPRLRTWIAPDGVLVWESQDRLELPEQPGWREVDSRRYGAARFHFLEPV